MNEKLIIEVEARARQAIAEFDRLDSAFKRVTGDNKRLQTQMWKEYNAGVGRATTGNQGLLASLKTIGPAVVGAFAVHEVARFSDSSLRATDRIAGVKRGLETVYGSAQRAEERFRELNEIAKFPGLDPAPLAKYDAIFKNLGSTAENNNIIFSGTAKAVTTFGGNVHNVNSTLFQLSQAFGKNKIDAQDFKSMIEQTSGAFLTTAQDVLKFEGGIEALRAKFNASGQTLQEFLLPVFAKLNEEFEGAPVNSYANAMDNLGVAFTNFTAAVIGTTEPVGKFVGFLTKFFENEAEVWREMRTGGDAIKAVGEASKVAAAEVQVLQKDLVRVNTTLSDAVEKYNRLEKDAISPNTAAMQHLQRRIDALRETSENLSGQLEVSATDFLELLKPLGEIDTAFRVLKQEVEAVDTRFMTFGERSDALKASISALPPEIAAVRTEFDALAPTAGRVAEVFKDVTVSLADVTAEQNALAQSSRGLIHELNILERIHSPFKVLHEDINLVNPAISRAVDSIKAYNTELNSTQLSTEALSEITSGSANRISEFADEVLTAEGVLNNFAKGIDEVVDKSITLELTSERLRASLRDQSSQSSAFDALRASVGGVSAKSDKLPGELLDISDALDVLDKQIQYTGNGFSELGDAIGGAVSAIDTMTPMIEDVFGIDMTSQRSHGRLAVNAASGIGQFASGDVVGGISNIIMSMYEWGQPDQEKLQTQHEEALAAQERKDDAAAQLAKSSAELQLITQEFSTVGLEMLGLKEAYDSYIQQVEDAVANYADIDPMEITENINRMITNITDKTLKTADLAISEALDVVESGDSKSVIQEKVQTAISALTTAIDQHITAGLDFSHLVAELNALRGYIPDTINAETIRAKRERSLATAEPTQADIDQMAYEGGMMTEAEMAIYEGAQAMGMSMTEWAAEQERQSEVMEKHTIAMEKRNADLLESSRSFVQGVQGIFTDFQSAADAQKSVLPSAQYVPGRTQGQAIAADKAYLESLPERTGPNTQFSEYARLTETLTNNINTQLEGLFQGLLGDRASSLLPLGGIDALEVLGIRGVEHLSPERLANEVAARLPAALEQIESGSLLGSGDAAAERLSEVLQSFQTEEEVLSMGLETLTGSVDTLSQEIMQPGLDAINESVLTLPQEMTPRLDAIEVAVNSVVEAVHTLANQPVSVSVAMNTGGQVIDLISDALANRNVEGTRFR